MVKMVRFMFFVFKSIYLFLAVLGLRCCTQAFSSCSKWGLLFVVVRGFSLRWLLLLRSTGSRCAGFSSCGTQAQQLWLAGSRAQAQQLWRTGLVAPRHVGSSQTRARTRVPCIGRRILNHCATREAHVLCFVYPTTIFKIQQRRKKNAVTCGAATSLVTGGTIKWCDPWGQVSGGFLFSFSFSFFFFGHAARLAGSQFPNRGLNPGPGSENTES